MGNVDTIGIETAHEPNAPRAVGEFESCRRRVGTPLPPTVFSLPSMPRGSRARQWVCTSCKPSHAAGVARRSRFAIPSRFASNRRESTRIAIPRARDPHPTNSRGERPQGRAGGGPCVPTWQIRTPLPHRAGLRTIARRCHGHHPPLRDFARYKLPSCVGLPAHAPTRSHGGHGQGGRSVRETVCDALTHRVGNQPRAYRPTP